MKKIRIGNDIRLAVDLRQYLGGGYLREREVYNPGDSDYENIDNNPFVNKKYEVYYPNQYVDTVGESIEFIPEGTPISIRSVKAFLINTSRQEEFAENLKKKSRFISRFPIEPYIEAFHATPYDICNSGYPTWRAYPRRHMFAPYHGFGLHPQWGGIYKPLPMVNDTEYVATVAATNKQNVVEVIFPARHLLHVGTYKLVLVVQAYAPGFNSKNLKTITVDVPNVFELVKTTEDGVDTGISVNVQNVYDRLPSGEDNELIHFNDVYVNNGSVVDDPTSNSLILDRTDGSSVNIDLNSVTGWYNEED